jgi:hypothetical protein
MEVAKGGICRIWAADADGLRAKEAGDHRSKILRSRWRMRPTRESERSKIDCRMTLVTILGLGHLLFYRADR